MRLLPTYDLAILNVHNGTLTPTPPWGAEQTPHKCQPHSPREQAMCLGQLCDDELIVRAGFVDVR